MTEAIQDQLLHKTELARFSAGKEKGFGNALRKGFPRPDKYLCRENYWEACGCDNGEGMKGGLQARRGGK